MHRFTMNEFECVVLNVGQFTMNAETLMGTASPQAREAACQKYGFDPDAIVFQMNPLYVNTGQQQVIIDPGTHWDTPESLMNALRGAEIDPGQITHPVLSPGKENPLGIRFGHPEPAGNIGGGQAI